MSTSHHLRTDGATEVMNRMIKNYLKCFCAFHERDWGILLTTTEFAYNSANVNSMTMSPFEIDIRWYPKSPLETLYRMGPESVQTITDFKIKLDEAFKTATFAQRLAQARQAAYTGKRYTLSRYAVDDEVCLSRKLFVDSASAVQPFQKLSVRRIGSVRDSERIEKTLYVSTFQQIYQYTR